VKLSRSIRHRSGQSLGLKTLKPGYTQTGCS